MKIKLKKLLKDEIKKRTKINLVESKKFSEMLEDAIKRYHNGMIDTVEFLEKVPYRDIQSHFDQARIFVNTSSDEGVPNTFIHAGLGATAIVSLKVDPDYMFHHFQAGCCAENKMEKLIKELQRLLSDEKILYLAQQEASRFVCEWHDNKKNVEIFLESLQPSASSPRYIPFTNEF